MREGQFIKRNINRWKQYQNPTENPDELASRFTHLVEDLSYAKTFYPFSNTAKYINGLAASIFLSIYKNKKEEYNRIAHFVKIELPLIIHKHHKTLLLTFLFFALFVAIGLFSAHNDQIFVRSVLGDGYVDMTERNIANGDPFGVYKDKNEFFMFVRIGFNNILVAFNCFVLGMTLGIGTLYMLFKNGLMLGVFEQMFISHGLGISSLLVILIHGVLELSAIVIASCTGLILGNSILFPGTFTRLVSLKKGAKDAVKIIVSLVPIFILAAFFESYITRYTQIPLASSIGILAITSFFMFWYFVIYPIKVSKRLK